MTKTAKKQETKTLSELLSKEAQIAQFKVWLIGVTPLIVHAWSEKARREMLEKHVKATKGGRQVRDPDAEFRASLYEMGDGFYGFPAMGIKQAICSAAHKDKGIPHTHVMKALWVDAEMVRTRPAKSGAICDMPLVRIYGNEPEMREDMVKIGGTQKGKGTAALSYRAQFTDWAICVTGEINTSVVTETQLAMLIKDAGRAFGLGEWRHERDGIFGSFRLGTAEEEQAWEEFAANNTPQAIAAE